MRYQGLDVLGRVYVVSPPTFPLLPLFLPTSPILPHISLTSALVHVCDAAYNMQRVTSRRTNGSREVDKVVYVYFLYFFICITVVLNLIPKDDAAPSVRAACPRPLPPPTHFPPRWSDRLSPFAPSLPLVVTPSRLAGPVVQGQALA